MLEETQNNVTAAIVICLIIIMVMVYVINTKKINRAKTKNKKVNTEVTNNQSLGTDAPYIDLLKTITIETSGFSKDRWLTKTQVINMLEHKWMMVKRDSKFRLRILCFSDIIIPTVLSMECNRTIEMLQAISKFPIAIDWVLTGGVTKDKFFVYIKCLNITHTHIYNEKRFLRISTYDMILHPYSGLNSCYEIIAGFIKKLKEEIGE